MGRVVLGLCVCVALWLAALPAANAQRVHRVGSGQTLSHVARRYRVSIYDLRVHNRLGKGQPLRLGQVLHVPPRGLTYVRPGQTLSHVARDHNCTIAALARANRMRPDEPLRAGQRLLLPGFRPAGKKDWGEPEHPGRVTLVHDGSLQPVQLVDEEGRVSRLGLIALADVMREHGEDARRVVHPRLALLLARISDHFGGRPVHVVSGFRDAGGYTSENSRHVAGRAADIQVRGVPRRSVWEFCRRLKGAGCGFYPNSVFTHVDARRARTQWVDWSRPGRKPRYGTLRGPTRNRKRRGRMPYPGAEGEVPLSVTVVEDAYVALGEDGQPLSEPKLTVLDDRALDPAQDRDIAERDNPDWARLACVAPAHAWVPFSLRRVPAME